MSGKQIDDLTIIRPDRHNEILELVHETAVMVRTTTEEITDACRTECATFVRKAAEAVDALVCRLQRTNNEHH